jgi:hypothetical protein
MKAGLLILIMMLGLILLFGFTEAVKLAAVNQNNPKTSEILWLTSAILFIAASVFFLFRKDIWWILSAVAMLITQCLIIANWHEAKFGTFANVIILFVTIVGYRTWSFSSTYKSEVASALKQATSISDSLLIEADIQCLPEQVKKYLRCTGAVNKPKVKNFKVELSGQIRMSEKSEWMPFTSQQYNFMDASTRLFFIKATMKHLPVAGFHSFKNGNAYMDIRLMSLFKVQYQSGKEMDISETVTFFNDMCCMAPATLIDKRVKWLEVDGNKVHATFTNSGITISAWLYFNNLGELVNFISDDRYAVTKNNTVKRLPWSTPVKYYKKIGRHNLATFAETIYSYPEGDFCYGNFGLTNIEYNCK